MHVFVNRQKDVWDSIIERRGHVHWHSQISKLNPRIHQCHFIWNAELNSNNTNTHCSKMADIMRLLDLISPLDNLQNKFVLLFTILKSVYLCNSLFTVKQDTFFHPSYCCLEWNYFSVISVLLRWVLDRGLPAKLQLIWPSVSEGKIFRTARYKNCIWRPCLLSDRNQMSNFIRGPSIDASYHNSVLLSGFRGELFLEIHQPETRIANGRHICKRIGMIFDQMS